jgi:hypothetical protein
MNDLPLDPRTPAEEDPVLHEHLVFLPALSPRPGFAERVLVHVWLPLPPWLRRLRHRGENLRQSRRLRALAAPFVAGACVTLVTSLLLAVTQPRAVRAVWNFTVEYGITVAWEAVVAAFASMWANLLAVLSVLSLTGANLVAAATAVLVLWAACAWGLYRTLQPRSF